MSAIFFKPRSVDKVNAMHPRLTFPLTLHPQTTKQRDLFNTWKTWYSENIFKVSYSIYMSICFVVCGMGVGVRVCIKSHMI